MSNKCDLCDLCGFSNPSCIWGTGPKKADIMIINASAGDKDEESGEATHNYGYVSLHNQSHGESFLSIVQNRFSGKGLYLLDEPEAALSPMRLMTLIVEIDKLLKNNSQFIIATHSPILMAFPNAEILQFSESRIEEVKYYETEHYKTTKLLIEEPEKTIHYLIDYNN